MQVLEKILENCVFSAFLVQKGYNSNQNWRKLTTLKFNLGYSKTKSYAKLKLNMSKHVEKNAENFVFLVF